MNKKISFVLSTGRTATLTITKFLNTDRKVWAVHEPKKSRRYMILTKYWRQGIISKKYIKSSFIKTKLNNWKHIEKKHYIEVNTFNWAYGDCICENLDNPHILHVVRDIPGWLISALNGHGLTKYFRWAKYFVPFWEINPKNHIENYEKLTHEEKRIMKWTWRWIIKNSTMNKISNYTKNYYRVKFEDIVSKNIEVQKRTIQKISDFFNIAKY